ncbi:MAG: transporter substrate-binding domain-containing protein [Gammaproteobacteria bacterium]|nr:transporter substrate-binding domain-containing protein [Gammaproteobacteria bacterium]
MNRLTLHLTLIIKLLLLGIVFFCNTLSAAPQQVIRFATEGSYPPFEFIDQQGKLQGFDIDIAKAICNAIKAECTFANQAFNSLLPSLIMGKFDALIAAIGVTPERAKQVAFTQSYYIPTGSFVGRLSQYEEKQTQGIPFKIGVQEGTTFAQYLRKVYQDKATIRTYISVQDAFLDLSVGRLDLVLADTAIANQWLLSVKHASFSLIESISNAKYFGEGFAIAVAKNQNALLSELNSGLEIIKANGTYDTLYKKYFGKPIKSQ